MKVLVLAPHADDEVLGMGGTIAKLIDEGHDVTVAILTGHGEEIHPIWPKTKWNEIREECELALKSLGVEKIVFEELPAACLDFTPAYKINSVISRVVQNSDPEIVFVPFAYDLHKDHGAVAYGASVALRPYLDAVQKVKKVLAYETLSETHLAPAYLSPAFQPNVFINITNTIDKKLTAMHMYKSQIQPNNLPRSEAGLKALAKLRGTHIGVNAAEGFVLLGEYIR